MCVLAMRNVKLYVALFGILALLLLLSVVNEKNWKPLQEKFWWNVTANYSKNLALRAVDNNLKTRWSSYAPMSSGMFFQVDVGKAIRMNGVLLQVDREQTQGQPKSWTLKGSLNGKDWYTLDARPGLTYKGMLLMPFKAVQARYIQIIQTSINSTPSPWMIYEIDILQPVVPWQFSSSTLPNVIAGWLLVILAVVLFSRRTGGVALTIGMIAILLLGWFLRSYGLAGYEFSEHEYRFFQRLAFGRYAQGEWLRAYLGLFSSGDYWLYCLLLRLAYQFWHTPLTAFRVVSGLFSLGAITAAFFAWRNFSQSKGADWEAFLLSALLSVSGWQVYLSRSGDFSGSFLCVFLLYLLPAYSFLYKRRSFLQAFGLAVVLCLGIFLHPVMGLVPIGILCFGGWHLWLCKYAPTFFSSPAVRSFHFRHHLPRVLVYFLSTLPGLAYWLVLLRLRFFQETFSWDGLRGFWQNNFMQMLHSSGIMGLAAWLFWGLVLLGLLSIVKEREHSEWFLVGQIGISLFVLTPFLFDEQHVSAFSLLVLLLLCLFVARGLLEVIAFLSFRQRAKPALQIRIVLLAVVLGYAVFVCASSLFFRSTAVAGEAARLTVYGESMKLTSLLQQVASDPVECHRSVMLEEELAAMYQAEYGFESSVRSLADLIRRGKQGIFYFYAFVRMAELETYPNRKEFFDAYYSEQGRTSQVVLYRLRDEFSGLSQRYYARDLFSATGTLVKDRLLPMRLAREATPDDRPGLMVFGPFVRHCEAGDYVARFRLRLMKRSHAPVVTLKVMADRHELFGTRELSRDDFPKIDQYYSFEIPFQLDFTNNPAYQMKRLEFLVDFQGEADIRVDFVELSPVARGVE